MLLFKTSLAICHIEHDTDLLLKGSEILHTYSHCSVKRVHDSSLDTC